MRAAKIVDRLQQLSESPFVVGVQDAVTRSLPFVAAGLVLFWWIPPWVGTMHWMDRALHALRGGLAIMAICVAARAAWTMGEKRVEAAVAAPLLLLSTLPPEPERWTVYLAQGGLFLAVLLAAAQGVLQRRVGPISAALLILAPLLALRSVVDFASATASLFAPLATAGDSLPSVLAVILCIALLTLAGLHGSGIVAAIVFPVYVTMWQANIQAVAAGGSAPYIVTPYFLTWCFLGGMGCTLPLNLYLLRARSSRLRHLAKVGLLPAVFNINETLVYGLPIVMNPLLGVPFVLCPLLVCLSNYCAIAFGWINPTYVPAPIPFVVPTPVAMFIASGGDVRAALWCLLNLALCAAVWWPFCRAYDHGTAAEAAR